MGPVRRAGVDHLDRRVLDHGDRLARRLVGQAKDGQVGGVQHPGAGGGVLAVRFGEAQKFHVGAARQPGADLQARRTGLAIDKNFRGHGLVYLRPSDRSARTVTVK